MELLTLLEKKISKVQKRMCGLCDHFCSHFYFYHVFISFPIKGCKEDLGGWEVQVLTGVSVGSALVRTLG